LLRPNSPSRGTNWFQVSTVKQFESWTIATRARSAWTASTAMAPFSGLRPSLLVRDKTLRNSFPADSGSTPNRSTNRSSACRESRIEL